MYACAYMPVCVYACRRHIARHLYVCMQLCTCVYVCMACGAVSCNNTNHCDCVAGDNCTCDCRPYPCYCHPPLLPPLPLVCYCLCCLANYCRYCRPCPCRPDWSISAFPKGSINPTPLCS